MDAHVAPALTGSRPPPASSALYDNAPEWCPWLHATGPSLRRVINDVVGYALHVERTLPGFERTRARRPKDLVIFRETVDSLLSHVAYEYLRGAGPVSISLANDILRRRTRYLSPLQSKQLPKIIKLLGSTKLNVLTVIPGQKATAFSEGRLTRISAGPSLMTRLKEITLDDIERREGEEIILLKGDRDDETGVANLIDYDDNELADGYRTEMKRINAHLACADISYRGTSPIFDERKCHLVRRFTRGQWGTGGRLWGGFWDSPMTKAERLSKVEINSEPVVSVDFSSMVLRLAYAYAGVEPPEGDLYQRITFRDTEGKPRALPRDVVKKIVAARLNGAKDWPTDLREHRTGLPWVSGVVAGLKAAHPALADVFDRDLGQELMFTESEILVDALLRLIDQEITALPLHDCVLVATSDEAAAVAAMLAAFKFHTKQDGRVTVERAP